MQYYGVNELREMFLKFFESKGHLRMNSFSLVPHNDKSLLIINSGMAPLKPYFTGEEIPPRRRVTTCQALKCSLSVESRTPSISKATAQRRGALFFIIVFIFSFAASWTATERFKEITQSRRDREKNLHFSLDLCFEML